MLSNMHRSPTELDRARRLLLFASFSAFATVSHAAGWAPAGPADGGVAPTYGGVATHPIVAGQTMIVAGYVPGVADLAPFFTSDGGAHWIANARPGGAGRPFLGGAPTVAYLAENATVLRSPDQGRTWAPILTASVAPGAPFTLWAVNPADGAELVGSSGDQLLLSRDSGTTWEASTAPAAISMLVVDWSTRTVYTGFGSGQPVGHRSLDAPGTWGAGGSDPRAIGAGHGVVMYNDGAGALFRSIDGGNVFTPVTQAPIPLDLCEIEFANVPADRVYALECSSGRVLRSNDAGASWAVAGTLPDGTNAKSLAVDGGNAVRLYVATARGVLGSPDGGATYAPLDRTTRAPGSDRTLWLDATDAQRQWLCCSSTGFQRSTDGGATFSEVASQYTILRSSRDRGNTLFGAAPRALHAPPPAFSVSTDGGTTFDPKLAVANALTYGPIAYGPASGQLFLYTRTQEQPPLPVVGAFHVSIDDGETWSARFAPPLGVNALAATPSGPLAIYAGGTPVAPSTSQLFRSTDGAVTWQPVAAFPARQSTVDASTSNTITALAIDPSDPGRIYAGFEFPDYVMRSDDAGATWTRATIGLGAGEITSLVIDPANPSTIFASQLGAGVFRSTDRGATWTALDEGLHDDVVLGVVLDPHAAGRVYAETGSGLYRADLGSGVPEGDRRAIEFYHHDLNHYFVSADTDEIAGLDAGVFQGWARTGEGFRVAEANDPGNSPVCRYFGVFPPQSTHFYSPYPHECEILATTPPWIYEKIAFGLALPTAPPERGCPPGTRALRRFYNNSMGGLPNHRYSTSMATFDAMVEQGWTFEGEVPTLVFACVPY